MSEAGPDHYPVCALPSHLVSVLLGAGTHLRGALTPRAASHPTSLPWALLVPPRPAHYYHQHPTFYSFRASSAFVVISTDRTGASFSALAYRVLGETCSRKREHHADLQPALGRAIQRIAADEQIAVAAVSRGSRYARTRIGKRSEANGG